MKLRQLVSDEGLKRATFDAEVSKFWDALAERASEVNDLTGGRFRLAVIRDQAIQIFLSEQERPYISSTITAVPPTTTQIGLLQLEAQSEERTSEQWILGILDSESFAWTNAGKRLPGGELADEAIKMLLEQSSKLLFPASKAPVRRRRP
jgi:hypothetical protein